MNKKLKNLTKFAAILFAALSILWVIVEYTDDVKKDLFQYISTNSDIKMVIGKVEKIYIYERRYVQGTPENSGYRKYFLTVTGSKKTTRVTVLADQDEQDKWIFTLKSIEH